MQCENELLWNLVVAADRMRDQLVALHSPLTMQEISTVDEYDDVRKNFE